MPPKDIKHLVKKHKLNGYIETSALTDPDGVAKVFREATRLGLNVRLENQGLELIPSELEADQVEKEESDDHILVRWFRSCFCCKICV